MKKAVVNITFLVFVSITAFIMMSVVWFVMCELLPRWFNNLTYFDY